MRIARWKLILPIAIIVAVVAVWLAWPWVTYRFAIHRLNGTSSGGDWHFEMNTYSDRISSADVAKFYSEGSGRLTALNSASKSYTYGDSMGYMGCVTVTQHPTCYDYVEAFGANDNDSISVGRVSGIFPPKRHSNVTQIPTGQLPTGIIRPW